HPKGARGLHQRAHVRMRNTQHIRSGGRLRSLRWMLVFPMVFGAVPLAAAGSAHAGPASDPAVVAASVAPDNDRVCKTSRVPVDLQPGITIAPGSDLGLTFDKEKSRQYLYVKLCLP